jgi:hypothetical protein
MFHIFTMGFARVGAVASNLMHKKNTFLQGSKEGVFRSDIARLLRTDNQ